jgi:hypothetical protein
MVLLPNLLLVLIRIKIICSGHGYANTSESMENLMLLLCVAPLRTTQYCSLLCFSRQAELL